MSAPLLVFAWGNRSRGDDALGPLFLEGLQAAAVQAGDAVHAQVQFLEDFQLQIEHALDLVQRRQVLFVDASCSCQSPFEVRALAPARDASFSTHAMSPEALLQVFCDLYPIAPPPCVLLAIRGSRFGLGEPLGTVAAQHLDLALQWGRRWLQAEVQPVRVPA